MAIKEVIRDETRCRLRQEIEQLPADQRQALDLRLQGRSTREIASLLGANPPTVRKRLSRAVHRLREVLQEQGPTG